METHYEYRIRALCTGARKGVVHADDILPAISFSAPPEFLGETGRWSPEHFLVASVASCFVATFSGIAKKSQLDFASFELDAEGVVMNSDGGWRFREITLLPVVTVLKEVDHGRAARLLEKAEKSCLIAHSLQCQIIVRPVVKIEEELVAPIGQGISSV